MAITLSDLLQQRAETARDKVLREGPQSLDASERDSIKTQWGLTPEEVVRANELSQKAWVYGEKSLTPAEVARLHAIMRKVDYHELPENQQLEVDGLTEEIIDTVRGLMRAKTGHEFPFGKESAREFLSAVIGASAQEAGKTR